MTEEHREPVGSEEGRTVSTDQPTERSGAEPIPPAPGHSPPYPGDGAVPERLRPSDGVGRERSAAVTERHERPHRDPQHDPQRNQQHGSQQGNQPPLLRRGPRRAHLAIKRVDPWTVLKVTFVFSLAMLIVGVVAVVALYVVLGGMGVFDSITKFLQDVSPGSNRVQDYAPLSRVAGGAAVIGAVNVVLTTALATLGAFIYNLCADLVGGIEVTLTERD